MDDLLSEEEQIDQIRSWWSEYGAYVIGGIVIGGGFLFSVNSYQANTRQAQIDASASYEALLDSANAGNLDAAETAADKIASSYAGTTYVAQSQLAMARLYMDKNRDQDAADSLRALVDSEAGSEFRHVARLRLTRILLYQDKAQEAVDLLEGQDSTAFAAAYAEVLGDAYHALGRDAEAISAYQQVLTDPMSEGTVDQQLVQWKALDLPEAVPEIAATDAVPETPEPEAEATVESSEPEPESETVE